MKIRAFFSCKDIASEGIGDAEIPLTIKPRPFIVLSWIVVNDLEDIAMKEVSARSIASVVERLCIESNCRLPDDIKYGLGRSCARETWGVARDILERLVENYGIAEQNHVPICQDTGMACVFLEIGQDVHISGDLKQAVEEGVRRGYENGYLRKSVVADPLERINTGDNTPAMLYIDIVHGEHIKITVAPKGFGSENMSQIKMLRPSDGIEGVRRFVIQVVEEAGPNPCPPVVVGVGIGGSFDKAALISKKALLRSLDSHHPVPMYARLEDELLDAINCLGIGPQGFGGRTTALGVNIETMPTHIAGLPCAVNIGCHVTRHCTEVMI